jgi:uncharacterized protein YyaL (SSP411 family)
MITVQSLSAMPTSTCASFGTARAACGVRGERATCGACCLEDYANLIEGLLALYETTFDPRWFVAARELADTMIAYFAYTSGGFFDTSDDAEALVTRPKDVQDNAVPSGNAMAATVRLKLCAFTGEGRYDDAAERALRMVQPLRAQAPTGFAQWLRRQSRRPPLRFARKSHSLAVYDWRPSSNNSPSMCSTSHTDSFWPSA